MKLEVFKTNGSASDKKTTLPSEIFGIEPNEHIVWLAVNAEMTNSRQGNAQVKTKSKVRGGGRKPWAQKGRGVARAGSNRSPIWVGGGITFGPSKREYSKKINKKAKILARKSVLSAKAKDKKIMIVEDFSFKQPKTKKIAEIFKNLKIDSEKILLITSDYQKELWMSCRNLKNVDMKEASGFSTRDVLYADTILLQKSSLKKIKEVLAK
ncbi:MAG: 50S ribosomal protein L4 [bacterium]